MSSEDLVAYLRARLDEEEPIARAAGADYPKWLYDRHAFEVRIVGGDGWSIAARKVSGQPINDVDGTHIAYWDPARVLADIEAKRRLVGEFERELADDSSNETVRFYLLTLVQPYSSRPDFNEDWRTPWVNTLHEQLLERCEADPCDFQAFRSAAALRAVVELHAPEALYTLDQQNKRHLRGYRCKKCMRSYPCEDTRAVASALGVETAE